MRCAERTWEYEWSARLCLEQIFRVLQHVFEKRHEEGITVVLTRHLHRPPYPLMDVDRPCTPELSHTLLCCDYAAFLAAAGLVLSWLQDLVRRTQEAESISGKH